MDENNKRNALKEWVALVLMIWFAYVVLGKPFDITIPFFGNWYNMTQGERLLVGFLSFFGAVYGIIISQFIPNKTSLIKIFGFFYLIGFGIIIVIYVLKSFVASLFNY